MLVEQTCFMCPSQDSLASFVVSVRLWLRVMRRTCREDWGAVAACKGVFHLVGGGEEFSAGHIGSQTNSGSEYPGTVGAEPTQIWEQKRVKS